MACTRSRVLPGPAAPFIVPPNREPDSASGRIGAERPMIDTTVTSEVEGDARARANVLRLAAAQAMTGANSAVIFATGSIVGSTLAPDVSLATVPLSVYVVGLACGTVPTGIISR